MKWITALNLNQWAEKIDARAVFSELIGDLIRASATNITAFRFPSGDKSQVRGFDGHLTSNGAPPYVPEGDSIWEFGCSGTGASKATRDYDKRTTEVAKEDRANLTLVIASPYTWDTPAKKLGDWLKEMRDKKEWKHIEYIDGSMVETWLDDHPAVAARYACELGLLPQIGVLSTDEFWNEYSTRFQPPLSEDVLLCGRQPQADKLLRALMNAQGTVTFAADSPDEVIAFSVAAIRKAEAHIRLFLEARTVIVDTQDSARLMASKQGLAFLPRWQARHSAGLLARSGSTVVGIGRDEPNASHEALNRPTSSALGKALATMGFNENAGYLLARKCGRSVTVLARLIPNGSAETPEWIGHGKQLLPALLAGGWNAISDLDTEILRDLGGVNEYEEVEVNLRPLTQLTDPPIDHIEDVWQMRAPVDAFVYIGHLIGAEDLKRLKAAATAVFGKIIDPPRPDELFSLDRREPTLHSNWLRDGLATTLLQIAVLHSQARLRVPGSTPQSYVNDIIRSLPGLSNDYRLLASLRDELPLLAEAAPDPFMEALEQMLEGKADALKPIFGEQAHILAPSSPHTGLLWALEVLAWDPVLLPRVALILAKLAAIDPGGRLSNRPINSLRSIFLSWTPNTNATLKQRLGALDYVINNAAAISWELLVTLLPRLHDSSSPTAKPKFREAAASEAENLTWGLVWESQREIISRALLLAEDNASRLVTIINSMHGFEMDSQLHALEVIERCLAGHEQPDREVVWAALRDESNKNKAFSNTDWSIKNDGLARIDQIVEKFQPTDLISLNVWLFDDWSPDVPGKLDDIEESVNNARKIALNSIFSQLGINGVQSLAEKAKLPQFVAITLEKIGIDLGNFGELVKNSLMRGSKLEHFAAVASSVAYKKYSNQWITHINEMAASEHWSRDAIVLLLVSLPDERSTWKIVAEFGQETEAGYWNTKHPFSVDGNLEDILFVANKYLGIGRPVAAIEALHRRFADVPTPLLLELLDAALSEINKRKSLDGNMFSYYVERLFDVLETRNDGYNEQIAQREYAYLPIFDRREKPLILHRLLMKNPELYVSVIRDVFKPASGEESEPDKASRDRAMASYRLLGSIKLLPGQDDENIDFDTLKIWCVDVRQRAANIDRADITDQYIGHILAHAPVEITDSAWPHIAVRRLLEELKSEQIERGVITERFNMRGVYSKSLDEGGAQERALAEQTRCWASAMPNYPRAAALLTRIGDSWDRQAEQEDINMAQQQLKW
ncbi:MAG: hypothetical protein ABL862_04200 [Candidatus Nitrotoga sp.]